MAIPNVTEESAPECWWQKPFDSLYEFFNYLWTIYNKIKHYIKYETHHLFLKLLLVAIGLSAPIILKIFSDGDPPLVVGVLSKRDHFMERLTIRNTWGVDVQDLERPTRLVFVLGDSDCPVHPSMRVDSNSCEAIDTNTENLFKWNSIEYKPDTEVTKSFSCVHGFGMKTKTDLYINSISVLLNNDEIPKVYIKFPNGSISSDTKIIPKDMEVEIVMSTNEKSCEDRMQGQKCMWSDGGASVEYTFVRFGDGSVERWNENFCVPFKITYENYEQKCPAGYQFFSGSCYVFASESRSWKGANEFCESRGSSLLTVESELENAYIIHMMPGSSSWLGLSKVNNDWLWNGNKNASYTNWKDGEPNNRFKDEDCTEILAISGKWNDLSCNQINGVACKIPRVHNFSGKVPINNDNKDWLKYIRSVDERVIEESAIYGDIISVSGLQDTYNSLPNKIKSLIKWTQTYSSKAWLFKTDDDTYVNVKKVNAIMEKLVTDTKSGLPESRFFNLLKIPYHKPTVFSKFNRFRQVPLVGKNAEYSYSSLTYPPFPAGAGYLMTDTVVNTIGAAQESLRTLQGEDVSVGLWLSALSFKQHPSGSSLLSDLCYALLHPLKLLVRPILAQISDEYYVALMTVAGAPSVSDTVALVSPSCWLGREEGDGCGEGEEVVVPQLSISDIVQRYKDQKSK